MLNIRLVGVDTTRAIQAIKGLRTTTGMGLRDAKMDHYDMVRDGRTIEVTVESIGHVDILRDYGWEVEVTDQYPLLTARVPGEQLATVRTIRALGGEVL